MTSRCPRKSDARHTDNTFDDGLRLTALAVDAAAPTGLTWDAAGRRRTLATTAGTTAVGYDTRGRATGVGFDTYDPAGYPSAPGTYWDYTDNVAYPTLLDGTWLGGRYDNATTPIGLAEPGELPTTMFSVDPLGSVIATLDTTGTTTHTPGPFGETTAEPGIAYRGETLTTSDSTYYLRNRYYDASTGTFLTTDPLDGVTGTPVETNPYHYTDNDPLNKVDPEGLRARDWEFRDPCWSTGGSQPQGGYGAVPFSELDGFGYIDFFDLDHQQAFGCVPLPPSSSLPGTYGGIGLGAVKGPELAVCRSDRAACLMAQHARRLAEADASAFVSARPSAAGPGGKGNAVQHVTWSALLSVFVGREKAQLFLHAHEAANPAPEGEYNQMDRANNFYGLRLVLGVPCVCLTLGEVLVTGDLAGQVEGLANRVRPRIRAEVDTGRVCTVAETTQGGLSLSQGCGQRR